MSKKQFKAESKRLLDLMINSIYTHKEIFLRELISNASDASDKLYYKALTENLSDINKEELVIEIKLDKEARTITISDHGIGMTKEELEENLGTIAKSGSLAFKNELNKDDVNNEVDIIGQFGVGFYASFMVANKVAVLSRKYNEEDAYLWVSEADDGYTISKSLKEKAGTTITMYLKENTDDENYDEYLDEYKIQALIKKYSDYVRYPIKMDVTTSKKKEDSDEYEDVVENKTLNSMVPLWKRNKNDITEDEYNEFYKDKFNDYMNPLKTIHASVEGNVSFDTILFIPSTAPHNFYSQEFEKGLQLYSRGVFIMDKADELVPEHFRFIRGLVDSQDLSLNISREMLQHDRQLKAIASRIEKRIKTELTKLLTNEREKYEEFFKNFGLQLKYGIYQSYGMKKDMLQDLLLYYSANNEKMITLKEYVESMKEDQKYIYFASGDSIDKISKLPQSELVLDKGYDIIYLTDQVDEFCLQMLQEFDGKTFKNIAQGDLDLETEAEKEEIEKKNEENKDLLSSLKDALDAKVVDVRVSSRLKSHPVCLVSSDGLSFEMEKVLSQMPGQENAMKAGKILEINGNHPIFETLKAVTDNELINNYATLLYNQALLIEGFDVEDPIDFSNVICDLMIKANK